MCALQGPMSVVFQYVSLWTYGTILVGTMSMYMRTWETGFIVPWSRAYVNSFYNVANTNLAPAPHKKIASAAPGYMPFQSAVSSKNIAFFLSCFFSLVFFIYCFLCLLMSHLMHFFVFGFLPLMFELCFLHISCSFSVGTYRKKRCKRREV